MSWALDRNVSMTFFFFFNFVLLHIHLCWSQSLSSYDLSFLSDCFIENICQASTIKPSKPLITTIIILNNLLSPFTFQSSQICKDWKLAQLLIQFCYREFSQHYEKIRCQFQRLTMLYILYCTGYDYIVY
jgi:hypothetical protein